MNTSKHAELARLTSEHERRVTRVRDLEREAQFASKEQLDLSGLITSLERRRGAGENVDAEVVKAEKALAKFQARAAEPWHERIHGAKGAARDSAAALERFKVANYDALAVDLTREAEAVTARVNRALQELVDAVAAREDVATEHLYLLAAFGPMKPGMVSMSRAEVVVREAHRLIDAGGEAAPLPRVNPAERHLQFNRAAETDGVAA